MTSRAEEGQCLQESVKWIPLTSPESCPSFGEDSSFLWDLTSHQNFVFEWSLSQTTRQQDRFISFTFREEKDLKNCGWISRKYFSRGMKFPSRPKWMNHSISMWSFLMARQLYELFRFIQCQFCNIPSIITNLKVFNDTVLWTNLNDNPSQRGKPLQPSEVVEEKKSRECGASLHQTNCFLVWRSIFSLADDWLPTSDFC